MRLRHRRVLITSVLAVFVLLILGLSVLFAGGPTPQYDTNSSGMIERDEAHNALRAYFDGDLTQEQALDVLFHYWAAQPVDQPAPIASNQPTPTPVPTSTPLPLSIQAPTITYTRVNTENMQVNWKHNAPNVTGYEVRYRPEGGAWTPWRKGNGNISGISSKHSLTLSVGDQVEVRVRSLTTNGASPWASETLGVPAPTATPTPRSTATPAPTPVPSQVALTNAYGNGCVGREWLGTVPDPDYYGVYFSFKTDPTETVSDIRLAAMFKNPPAPEREPWEAPKLPEFQYGFMVRSVPDQNVGLLVLVSSDKTWSVELRHSEGVPFDARSGALYERDRVVKTFRQSWGNKTLVRLGSGCLTNFDTEPLATNHVMFEVEGNSYRMAVNGVDVPLEVDAEELAAMEEHIGSYRHYDDGKWHGNYNVTYVSTSPRWFYGYPNPTTGGTYAEQERTTEPRIVTVHRPYPWVACVP